MEIHENKITFKSDSRYFELERNGSKANTVRLLDWDEVRVIDKIGEKLDKICIIKSDLTDRFERDLTEITEFKEVYLPPENSHDSLTLKKRHIFIFSWRHEE